MALDINVYSVDEKENEEQIDWLEISHNASKIAKEIKINNCESETLYDLLWKNDEFIYLFEDVDDNRYYDMREAIRKIDNKNKNCEYDDPVLVSNFVSIVEKMCDYILDYTEKGIAIYFERSV